MISTGMISGASSFGAPGGKKYSVKKWWPFSRIATTVTKMITITARAAVTAMWLV